MQENKQNVQQETQQFSEIINPNGFNIELFAKACNSTDVWSVVEFIETVQKILKLYDKPGR